MKKIVTSIAIGALALTGSLFIAGSASAAAVAPTVVLSGGSAVFGLDPAVIKATASVAGVVKFSVAGVVVTGCEAVPTTLVTPFIATCSWLPSASGPAVLTATLTPTDLVAYTPADSAPFNVKVGVPVQGAPSPITMYVDTVLASGSSGALAPRFGVSCAVASQFILGQTIVFRVYGNNSDLGGAVLDSSNVAKAYIEVSGVKDPLPLTYGNHSGVAFWTAVLPTGPAPKYNTLGVISYKVTMIAKDQDTVKVLSTKLVRRVVNGVSVKVNGRYVYDRVSYYRNVKVSPALKGSVGTWSSNFTPSSQLTLYAIPVATPTATPAP